MFGLGNTVQASHNVLICSFFQSEKKKYISVLPMHTKEKLKLKIFFIIQILFKVFSVELDSILS